MNKSIIITGILTLTIGLATGYWLSERFTKLPAVSMDSTRDTTPDKKEPIFYRHPMDPSITSPVPAKGSMGMDYLPVYADGSVSNSDLAGSVKIDPVVVQNIGVRTTIATRQSLSRTIRAVGRVDFEEEKMAHLHPKVEGWVEDIRVDKTGQNVAFDDILFSIYSPKLVSTQQEYLLALNNLEALKNSPFDDIKRGAEELVKSSRERLRLLDVADHQIHELEQSREIKKTQHIHSSVAGTVIRIGARQGQYVTPKTEIYMIVDLTQVWVYADIYEYELPWVKVGDKVAMTLAGVPGLTFKGQLSYIYPYAESKTRTTKVRLIFDNSELLLRPDMFSEVLIYTDTLDDAVVIPAEAIIRSGASNQVFVVRGPGKFEPRPVELGFESHGQVAILSGLEAGEEVVTSAQFLLDSESKLREATAKMLQQLNEQAPVSNKNSRRGE